MPRRTRREVCRSLSLAVLGTGGGAVGSVTASGKTTGGEEWHLEAGGAVTSSPTVVDGTVFVGAHDATVCAVNATTGKQAWVFETDDVVSSSLTVVDDVVFVGAGDGTVYALRADSGDPQWSGETESPLDSSPTVVGGILHVGSYDGAVYAIDATTGEQEWAFDTGSMIRGSGLTVAGGRVFVGNHDGTVFALEAATGDQRWTFETDGDVYSSPTVVDGTLFVGSADGNLYALEAGVSGSRDGSRVMLGTLGHHGDWQYADQTIEVGQSPTEAETNTERTSRRPSGRANETAVPPRNGTDETTTADDGGTPGFGLGAAAGAIGGGLLFQRIRTTDDE